MNIWVVPTQLLWLLGIMLQWKFVYKLLCEHMLSIFLVIQLGMELLSHMVIPCSIFLRNCQNFATVAEPFLHSHQQCMKILANTCPLPTFYYSPSNGCEMVSLVTHNIEQLFTGLLFTGPSSWRNVYSSSFPIFCVYVFFVCLFMCFLLKYSWLTLLYQPLLYSKLTQFYMYILLIFFSIMVYPERLEIVPCATQQDLAVHPL